MPCPLPETGSAVKHEHDEHRKAWEEAKVDTIRIVLLGESDEGFNWFTDGCPKLKRLEMRDCVFLEANIIAKSILKLKALKYVCVQGYNSTAQGDNLLAIHVKPYWNIKFCTQLEKHDKGL